MTNGGKKYLQAERNCFQPNLDVCGGTVVKVLCYKSEGRWFDRSWCHWIFR